MRLDDRERIELCTRIDFLSVLEGDGAEPRREGSHWTCRIRDERTPSCRVFPPGVGQRGSQGWTLHDFGDGWGGDALTYYIERKGLSFRDAVREMAARTGFTPEMLRGETIQQVALPTPVLKTNSFQHMDEPRLEMDVQTTLAGMFLRALTDLDHMAAEHGLEYIAQRGCFGPLAEGASVLLYPDSADKLTAFLHGGEAGPAKHFARAGLLHAADDSVPLEQRKVPFKTGYKRGPVCLLVCHAANGLPCYFVGRRLDWQNGDGQKYLNQPVPAGGPVRVPFNLPMLYLSAGRLKLDAREVWMPCRWSGAGWQPKTGARGKLIVVEGAMDALGAAVLGWPSIAMLQRPGAGGSAQRMLGPHLGVMRDLNEVLILPDADVGEKGDEGRAEAGRMAAWLNSTGVRARVESLGGLGLPEGIKDLAEAAERTT